MRRHRQDRLLVQPAPDHHVQLHRRQPGTVDTGQHRDQLVQVAAQQRLATGQAHLADPETGEDPGRLGQLLERQQLSAGQEREVAAENLPRQQ